MTTPQNGVSETLLINQDIFTERLAGDMYPLIEAKNYYIYYMLVQKKKKKNKIVKKKNESKIVKKERK